MNELPIRYGTWKPMKSAQEPTRVLIVDDHPVVCEALKTVLEQEDDIECCGTAESAREALEMAAVKRPHVAVVDISLSDTHGLSLVYELRSGFPGVHVVVFSMSHESAYAERAIRAGALGYVTKGESTRAVLDAIRSARDGRTYLNRSIASRMLGLMVHRSGNEARSGVDRLTDQELAVFQLMGQAHTVPEIADRLGVNRKTVVAYQRRVKAKLGLSTMGRLVQHALHSAQGVPTEVG